MMCGRVGAACSLGVARAGNHGTGTGSAGSVDGGAGKTSASTVGMT